MRVQLIKKSGNRKTGPIPVTIVENSTCPDSCSWKETGCYAKYSYLGIHWRKVRGRGMQWAKFCKEIAKLPENILWRYATAGDLPGFNEKVDMPRLMRLVEANKGKRGFTYTHKDVLKNIENRKAVRKANKKGFTINLSADNLNHADKLKALRCGPVAVVLPSDYDGELRTPKGHKLVVCPAQTHDKITCESCKLCAIPTRKSIVSFLAHGTAAKTVSKKARLNIVQ